MPVPFLRNPLARTLGTLLAVLSVSVAAQTLPATPDVDNSDLNAQLFYQLLLGEMELRAGDAGTAFQVVLDAAKRTGDEQLFRRATDIALQARAGDQALAAVMAWRSAVPASLDAHRYLVQMLIALNRAPEAIEPMRALIQLTPPMQRPSLIESLPRFFARSTDRKQVAGVIEQVLVGYTDAPETRAAALVSEGLAWLTADEPDKALALAQRAQNADPTARGPALLAIEMLPGTPAAEAVVTTQLQAAPASNDVRLVYVRKLTGLQRYGDAVQQLQVLVAREPKLAPPLLTLGALQVELRQPAQAIAALEKYLQLEPSVEPAKGQAAHGDDEEDAAASPDEARTQAWLLLAQAEEQQGNYKAAETWLGKVDSPQRALDVLQRRASLLARQGKLDEARLLIRSAPERSAGDGRSKVLAEAQLLREAKQWSEALTLLTQANQRYPNDVELLYEESMTAEKLNRIDEMERLLRRVIELKPDHQHAFNALGYSLAERNVRLPEAKTLIQRALAISPGEPFITDSLGWVEYRMGNQDEALRLLRLAYKARPDPEIAAHLGEVLWTAGLRDEARQVLREGRSRDNRNDVLLETLARLKVDL